MNVAEQVKKFVEPESVTILGVPSRPSGEESVHILKNLLALGYQGRIYPVNPNATEIMGVKAYPSVTDIAEKVDLAVVNLPRSLVPGVVAECVKQGIQAVMIITQGFADAADEEGRRLQKGIDEILRKSNLRILGPNSLGTANAFINFSSAFRRIELARVPVGVICQTGVFLSGFPGHRFLGKGIDLGNAYDVNFTDALEYFEQDKETKVIALHIEGIRDGERFLKTASRVAQRKPVVALKTGRSEYAAQAAQSHTGSLVGRDELWEAALKQSGVIRVNDIDELGDSAMVFSVLPMMKGRQVGIITTSGGLGIVGIDACHKSNLEIAKLSSTTLEKLNRLAPAWHHVGNPADILPIHVVQKQPSREVIKDSMEALLSDAGVDAVLLIWAPFGPQNCAELHQVVVEFAEAYRDKPVLCSFHGHYGAMAKSKFEAAGNNVAVFHTPDRAIRALGHLARYSAFRKGF